MTRLRYYSPHCEHSAVEQESLLCSSYTSADREIYNLTDAYSDWDFVG
ncbi:MAG: hypothetical protein J5640_05865 [Bacteroidales bacterium]|nr:hypothetical protein [Bacteroidales bacterium]